MLTIYSILKSCIFLAFINAMCAGISDRFTTFSQETCFIAETCGECVDTVECLWCDNGTSGFCLPFHLNNCPLIYSKWVVCWMYMDIMETSLIILAVFTSLICIVLVYVWHIKRRLKRAKKRRKRKRRPSS